MIVNNDNANGGMRKRQMCYSSAVDIRTYRPAPVFESRGSETKGPPNLARRPAPAAIDEVNRERVWRLVVCVVCGAMTAGGRSSCVLCWEQSKVTGGELCWLGALQVGGRGERT